jgi:hypothetical protein
MDEFSAHRRRVNEERIARALRPDPEHLGVPQARQRDRYAAHRRIHETETRLMELGAALRLHR